MENNNFYIEKKLILDEYLNKESGEFILIKCSNKNSKIESLNEFLNKNNINVKLEYSLEENIQLKHFFVENLKIESDIEYLIINENKIVYFI